MTDRSGSPVHYMGMVLLSFGALQSVGNIVYAAECGNSVICDCGDTVVDHYVLPGDLVCPDDFSGHALTIGAHRITIDGQGQYKIEAEEATAVIYNSSYSDWTLRHIAIKGGFYGIHSDGRSLTDGASGILIDHVDAASPRSDGQRIRFLDTHSSRVENSQADGGDIGIYNLNGDGNVYVDTSASWRPDYGPLPPDTGEAGQNQVCVQLIGVHDNVLERIIGNGRRIGVDILGDSTSANWGNRASDRNIIRESDLSGNGGGISFRSEGHGNQYLHNDLSDSDGMSIGEPTGVLEIALQVNGDSGVVIAGNDYRNSVRGISLANLDAQGETLLADVDLKTLSGTYGLRLNNVRNARFERIEIGSGTRQSLWWGAGSAGNEFHQISAHGNTFGLLSQGAHDNRVTESDFSWTGDDRQATGIDLRLGSTGNVFDNVTVHHRLAGAKVGAGAVGTTIQNSDLSRNHNCISATTDDPAAGQRFHDLQLNHCTGLAMVVRFDNSVDLRDLDFTGSSSGLFLQDMSGIHLDGTAQGLHLADVTNRALSLIRVDDSSLVNFTLGGVQDSAVLHDSHRNLLADSDVSWTGPSATGNGVSLFDSTANVIRDSTLSNRALGLQILSGSNDNQVRCNIVTDNHTGVLNHLGASGNLLRMNVFSENADYGVRNTDHSVLIATDNYWGHPDGPSPLGSGDVISGPIDFTPFASSANSACGHTPTAPLAFACSGEPYLAQGLDTEILRVDLTSEPVGVSTVGGPRGREINNLGFRSTDGLLYGVELSPQGTVQIVCIDARGDIFGLGPGGLPTDVRFGAGDVSSDGETMFVTSIHQDLYRVPLPALTPVTSVAVTGATGLVFDWAHHPVDDLLYGCDSSDGEIAMLDPVTGHRTDIPVDLPTGDAFGGVWLGGPDTLFCSRNSGEIYEIDLTGPTISNIRSGPGTDRNDAASCVQSVLGAAKQITATRDGLPKRVTIRYVFENLSADDDLFNLTATDDLTTLFGIPGDDWIFASITSLPDGFANSAFHGIGELVNQTPTQSLPAGTTATVTVEIDLMSLDSIDPGGELCTRVAVVGENIHGVFFGDLSTSGLDPDPNGDGSPSEFAPSCLNLVQVPFACSDDIYMVRDADAQLARIDSSGLGFDFDLIGAPAGVEYNNLGYRQTDGLLYAVELTPNGNHGLVRIDATGQAFPAGQPSGLPADVRFDAGDVSPDGRWMYVTATNKPLYTIDLNTPSLETTSMTVTGSRGHVFDWAAHPTDGKLYGGDSSHGQLAILNPQDGHRTDHGLGLPTKIGFGGAWFRGDRLFLYRNNGEIYEIDPSGPTILGIQNGPGSNRNDAAGCTTAPLVP